MEASKISLTGFRAFEAVARHMSFRAAADEMHLTPSAISFQVRNLELALGVKLFERRSQTIRLSLEGRQLLPAISNGFCCFNEAIDSVRFSFRPDDLVVKMMQSGANKWLTPRLLRFISRYPRQGIRFANIGVEGLFSEISSHVEITPVNEIVQDKTRYVVKVFGDHSAPLISPDLWASLGRPTGRALLEAVPLISDVSGIHFGLPDFQDWLDIAGFANIRNPRRITTGPGDLAIEIAVGGAGIALARLGFALEDIAEGRLVAPFDLVLCGTGANQMTCSLSDLRIPMVRNFVTWMEEEIEEYDIELAGFLADKQVVSLA